MLMHGICRCPHLLNKAKINCSFTVADGRRPTAAHYAAYRTRYEEMSVPMHKQRSQPQPGVTHGGRRSSSPADNLGGVIVSNAVARSPALVYTARLQPNAAARLEQFAIDVPDIGPQWAADRFFIRSSLIVSPVIFLVKLKGSCLLPSRSRTRDHIA